MTQEELKRQLDGILMNIEFPDATPDEKGVYVLRRNDIEGYFARLLPHYASDIADVLVSEGLIFKKDYRKSRSAELARQEQFAEEQGFAPDCSPYYIALQYKKRAESIRKETAQEIFGWFWHNLVNLNFITGNIEVNFAALQNFARTYGIELIGKTE